MLKILIKFRACIKKNQPLLKNNSLYQKYNAWRQQQRNITKLNVAPITINLPPDYLLTNSFIESEYYKTEQSQDFCYTDSYIQIRKQCEQHFFGKQHQLLNYGALNYTYNPKGAAPGYGSAYFVLKNKVKQRTSYMAEDSYDAYVLLRAGQYPKLQIACLASTFDHKHLYRLLSPQQLNALDGYYYNLQGTSLEPIKFTSNQNASPYIEAQVHGKISFANDVKSIVINFDAVWPTLGLTQYQKVQQKQIISNAIGFSQRNKINAIIVNSDGTIKQILHTASPCFFNKLFNKYKKQRKRKLFGRQCKSTKQLMRKINKAQSIETQYGYFIEYYNQEDNKHRRLHKIATKMLLYQSPHSP